MEMQMEVAEQIRAEHQDGDAAARLLAAAERLEAAADRLDGMETTLQATAALEQRLTEAEATIAALRSGGRKTSAAGVSSLLARESVVPEPGTLSGVLDSALGSLSLEQRIAVKSQLMRSGLLG